MNLVSASGNILRVSFCRAIRVPDNGRAYNLPPDCGPFPLYSVSDYEEFLPEALVKVFVGGVNTLC